MYNLRMRLAAFAVFGACLAAGCTGGGGGTYPDDPAAPSQERLANAELRWTASKASCRTYSYMRVIDPAIAPAVGYYRLGVEVVDDVPTRRHISMKIDDTITEYEVPAAEVADDPTAMTVEELIDWCKGLAMGSVTLAISDRGVPLTCTRVEVCTELCLAEVVLSAFACAPLTADGRVP